MGNGKGTLVCERYNDEINGALRRSKVGKSSDIDEVAIEYLKRGGE